MDKDTIKQKLIKLGCTNKKRERNLYPLYKKAEGKVSLSHYPDRYHNKQDRGPTEEECTMDIYQIEAVGNYIVLQADDISFILDKEFNLLYIIQEYMCQHVITTYNNDDQLLIKGDDTIIFLNPKTKFFYSKYYS